ncbi:MAG: hypothetical protein JNJ98_01195, partial [Gemmatimonadetes bacterium]|nr:hypothetical protein [Gemmatimonadota bacterium]
MSGDRRLHLATWAYAAFYAVWVLLMVAGLVPRARANDLLSLGAYFVPAILLFRAARSDLRSERERVSLAIMGTGWIGPGLSYLVAEVPGWELHPVLSPLSWGLYWSYYPLVLVGLMLLAIFPQERGIRARLAIDSGLVVVAAATLQWYFVVRMYPARSTAWETLRALGPLFPTELLIVFGAAVLVYRRVPSGVRAWPQWLGAGMFVSALSDFIYEYRKVVVLPWPGPAGDLLFVVSAALVSSAAIAAGTRPEEPSRPEPEPLPGLVGLPYVAITCVGLLLAMEAARGGLSEPVVGLVAGGASLVVLVIAKLAIEQRSLAAAHARQAALDARFRALVQRSTDAILVVASDGTIAYASPAFARLVAISSDPTGETLTALVPAAPPAAALVAGSAQGHPQRWEVNANGARRTLDAVISDLRHDPAVAGFVVNLRDVTEQVQLEQRLRDAQKLEVVGRLASSVAHDFNNLLTVVIGNASLALAQPAERTRPQWDAVRGAAERGAALARQLLSLGRPTPRSGAVIDLRREMERILEMLRTILPSSLQVRLSVPSTPVPAPIAASELEQVILNLALNARDAMSGAGTLSITLEADRPGGTCTVRVIDTGVGMDESTRARALDPFFTTKAPHEGTGLGLSTALQVVRSCGGELAISSHPGQGTTITITLPCLDGV